MRHFFHSLIPLSLLSSYTFTSQIVFFSPPEHFHPKIEVAACFMKTGDEFLFLKGLARKDHGETWGIPGGKCEKGETAQEAVIREVWEETGIVLKSEKIRDCGKVYFRHPTLDFTYYMFEYTLESKPSVRIQTDEHSDFRFLTLKEALDILPLMPGEAECIDYVYGIHK